MDDHRIGLECLKPLHHVIFSELTGLQGDELLDFMMYCRFNYYDLVRWSDEQIREKIRTNYFNYQYDKIANEGE